MVYQRERLLSLVPFNGRASSSSWQKSHCENDQNTRRGSVNRSERRVRSRTLRLILRPRPARLRCRDPWPNFLPDLYISLVNRGKKNKTTKEVSKIPSKPTGESSGTRDACERSWSNENARRNLTITTRLRAWVSLLSILDGSTRIHDRHTIYSWISVSVPISRLSSTFRLWRNRI